MTDNRAATARRIFSRSSIRVRLGEERDREAVLSLGRRLHAETDERDIPVSEAKLHHVFSRVISPESVDLGLVAVEGPGEDAPVVGFIHGTGGEHLYFDCLTATVILLYVPPDKRHTAAPFLLMRGFIRRAVAGGARAIEVQVASGLRVPQAHRFFTKLGFRFRGGNYAMLIRDPAAARTG